MNASLQSYWEGMDRGVKDILLLGSAGKERLWAAARAAMVAGNRELWGELALEAFSEDPVDGESAMELAGLVVEHEWGSPGLAPALRALAACWRKPDNLGYYQRLVERGDRTRMASYLEQQLQRPPASLFWTARAVDLALSEGDLERTLSLLEKSEGLSLLLDKPRGDLLALLGRFDEAEKLYGRVGKLFGQPWLDLWIGRSRLHAGDRDLGAKLLMNAVRLQPWRSTEILRLDEILRHSDDPTPPPGSVALCIHTRNQADVLAATLDNLARCDLDHTRLFVLDNGSDDHTPRILKMFQDRFGERMARVRLPVYVGAMAAQNWLAGMEDVAAADWIGFLDQSAEPPADFLGRFGAAIRRAPGAFVYGCRIANYEAPYRVLAADGHLRYPHGVDPAALPEADVSQAEPNPFRVCRDGLPALDLGRFGYLRPCISVDAACRLFPADALRKAGGFSLKFSPSNHGDLDLDLRLAESGGFAVYDGGLRVLRRESLSASGPVEDGDAKGNLFKLQCEHTKGAVLALMAKDGKRIEVDLHPRIERLDALPM